MGYAITTPQAKRLEVAAELGPENRLGSGGFADVYRKKYRHAGTKHHAPVALKVFRGASALPKKLLDDMRAEVLRFWLLGLGALVFSGAEASALRRPGLEFFRTELLDLKYVFVQRQ